MYKQRNKKGFTLVEIMIVVVIIGLLAAMAIPAFQNVRQNSREKAVLNNLRQIAAAAQQYMLEEGTTQVDYDTLATLGYFATIQTVSQEDYTALPDFTQAGGSVEITSTDAGTEENVIFTY